MRTIRGEFGDRGPARSSRARIYAELAFLIAGLLAIDCYIWIGARAAILQAYDHWNFSEQLQGRSGSPGDFIRNLLGLEARQPDSPRVANRPEPLPPSTRKPIEPLAVIGKLEIPSLHMSLMVREGVSDQALRISVGHVPSTALPGQPGNVALAAHRDTFFRPLRNIRKGDAITVQTLGGSFRYAVNSIRIVRPSDVSVLNASQRPELTLITCYPFYYVGSAPKRFIVQATQIPLSRGDSSALRAD